MHKVQSSPHVVQMWLEALPKDHVGMESEWSLVAQGAAAEFMMQTESRDLLAGILLFRAPNIRQSPLNCPLAPFVMDLHPRLGLLRLPKSCWAMYGILQSSM